MTQPDHITRDIARKCGDDVAVIVRRNMGLVDTPEAKLSVSLSAAASAMGAASGSYLAMHDARDQPPVHHLAAADGVWRSLRPMVLRAMADIHAVKGIEEPEWFPLPNPFAPVDILPADRDALYGGLISAGHPATYARHMAYEMPGDDGSLQMLARHRLAYSGSEPNMTAAFLPMDHWDQRDAPVLLLVDYREGGDHALDDAWIAITIGHNNDHNVGDDEGAGWQFAGWCWTHDHYVQGKGKPIGWMPLPHHLAAVMMEALH